MIRTRSDECDLGQINKIEKSRIVTELDKVQTVLRNPGEKRRDNKKGGMTTDHSCHEEIKETRLISIVSKPIIIVVVLVVIDVVFVKKRLGPKKFWLKKIHVKKTLCQNNFG